MAIYKIDNRPARIDFEAEGIIERTLQNAKNLLMTRMGEVPYDRLRGCDPALLDLPITLLRERLPEELDLVMMYEPDVEVVRATCRLEPDFGTLIEVELEIDIDE